MKPIISFLLLLCFFSVPAIATDRYVAPVGATPYSGLDDPSHDGTITQPWATPWYAATHMAAGDRALLRANTPGGTGTYSIPNDNVNDIQIVPQSSTTFTAWTDGTTYDDIHIDAQNRAWHATQGNESHGIFILSGVTGVTISHLTIGPCANEADIFASGILCLDSHDVHILYNHIYDTWGPSIKLGGCSEVYIDHNELATPERWEGRGNYIGWAVDGGLPIGSCTTVEVTNNNIHDTWTSNGVDFTNGANFIAVYNSTEFLNKNCSGIRIANNKIHHVPGQAGIYVISGLDTEISANEIYNCQLGICVSNENHPDQTTVDGVDIFNNVCHGNAAGIIINPSGGAQFPLINDVPIVNNTVAFNTAGGIVVAATSATGVVIRNNIAAYNSGTSECTGANMQIADVSKKATIDHNLISGKFSPYQAIAESDVAVGIPAFCNYTNNDYHIASNSNALGNASSDLVPAKDFDNNTRTFPYDIGAYEGSSACTAQPAPWANSPVYYITVQPKYTDGSQFSGPFDIRINGSSIVYPGKMYGYNQLQVPNCFVGTVAIEATGYRSCVSYSFLTNSDTPTLTMRPTPFQGTIATNACWCNTIDVNGDVQVASGVTLTIAPATQIKVATGDVHNLGSFASQTEFLIVGTLQVNGSSNEPVSFRSSAASPTESDWAGIFSSAGTPTLNINYAEVRDAQYGVGSSVGNLTLDHSTLHYNLSRDVAIAGGFSATAQVTNNTIDVGGGNGIEVTGGTATATINLKYNNITGSSQSQNGILINDLDVAPTIEGNLLSGFSGTAGHAISLTQGTSKLYSNDLRTSTVGLYINGGAPTIGASTKGNQISGCVKGIHAQCIGTGNCPSTCTINAVVKYNSVINNTNGIVADKTSAIDIGRNNSYGNNNIYNSNGCGTPPVNNHYYVVRTFDCGKVNAVGNYWNTVSVQPTCKSPNSSQAIDTGHPLPSSPAGSGCPTCPALADPPSMTIELDPITPEIDRRTRLVGIHPNPFNPTTTVDFELKTRAWTTISVYNVLGQLVRIESLGTQPAGKHNWVWKGTDQKGTSVSSGVYFIVLRAGTVTDRAKAVLLK